MTIEVATETQNEIGGIDRTWAMLTGHGEISCNVGRNDALGPKTSEMRKTFSTFDAKMFQAMLNGLYPAITEAHRAVIDSDVYNIRGVVHDSGRNLTELVLEIIT